jgi:hypothetical protein
MMFRPGVDSANLVFLEFYIEPFLKGKNILDGGHIVALRWRAYCLNAEEGLVELVAGEQLLARSPADNAAGLTDVAAVGEVERLAHVLLDQQDRHARGLQAPTHLALWGTSVSRKKAARFVSMELL